MHSLPSLCLSSTVEVSAAKLSWYLLDAKHDYHHFTRTSSFHLHSNSVQKVHDQHRSSFCTKGSSGSEGYRSHTGGTGTPRLHQHTAWTRLGRCQVDSTPDCEQYQFVSIVPQWQLTLHSVGGRLCCLILFNPYNTSTILAIILTNKWGSPVYNPHKVTEPSSWGASPSTDFSHCGVYGSVFFLGRVRSPWKRF